MPNKPVLAAAEGVSNAQPQSLSAAITRYRKDWTAFLVSPESQNPQHSDGIVPSWKVSAKIIEAWDRSAVTQSEAAEALRLALEDYDMGETPRIPAMMKAALGFLDRVFVDEKMPFAAEDASSYKDLEGRICNLRHMAAITDHRLDHFFHGVLKRNLGVPADQPITLHLDRDEVNELAFAYKQVFELAEQLRRDFYSLNQEAKR